MLSAFLKKLLFARQFLMIDGKIEVLGKRQIMLPSDVIADLQKMEPGKAHKIIKNSIKKDVEDYARKVGSGEEGMLRNISYIFETFGLGKLTIIDLKNKEKKCLVRIQDASLKAANGGAFHVLPAVLSGTFSFLFQKDVEAELTNKGKTLQYFEYIIK